jgi:hypothetical protein
MTFVIGGQPVIAEAFVLQQDSQANQLRIDHWIQ